VTERPDHGLAISLSPGEIRVALIEGGRLVSLTLDRHQSGPRVGDIFHGRLTKLDRAIGGGFVDVGNGETGFVDLPKPDPSLSEGDTMLLQVATEAEGGKQLGLRRRIELAGRSVLLVPGGSGVEISKRIRDAGRRKELKSLVEGAAQTHEGWVVRTLAATATNERILAEMIGLRHEARALKPSAKPGLARAEPDVIVHALRDLATIEMQAILLDDGAAFTAARRFAAAHHPALLPIIQRHQGGDLFEALELSAEIEEALGRRHPIPGGGALLIDATPTLTAIDIDREGAARSPREINLAACPEIARLIRLRDIGGIIVVDFLRMASREEREAVAACLAEALAADPVPTDVLGFTRAGLCELTRPRGRRALDRMLSAPCPSCQASGRVRDPRAVALEAIRAVMASVEREPALKPAILAAPAVARQLIGAVSASLDEAERLIGRPIPVLPDPALAPDRFLIGEDDQTP
jgi:ribonuclease G